MEQMFSVIANLGFPIAVSVYLLVRVENKLETLTRSIYELAAAISNLQKSTK
ncbi:MAG: YvrJ family protein [Xylanivirga thermophila]|jgi:hypothetical protein|uniref:YvrJ family protein n=1 Tax=Xylanivirga thermophila TaxID=2496273 RepID=UPI00101BCE75|nr:YvrJ family protein [Xylanivirga thermophila]